VPLYKVIVVSWLIAFFEYCFQVPAEPHRLLRVHRGATEDDSGSDTLTVFAAFSVLYLKQPLRWNYLAGFALIVAAVAVILKSGKASSIHGSPLEPLGLGSFGRARLPAVPLAIN